MLGRWPLYRWSGWSVGLVQLALHKVE